jgi:8-oxo-dGTP pyrophosphatase MutT (NUDIX family)
MAQPAAVVIFCQDQSGNVLAVSRKGNLDDLGLPGGKIELSDPTPVDAACREFYEEVGVPITPDDVRFVWERLDPSSGDIAWCYQLLRTLPGIPQAVEPYTWVGWVRPERLLLNSCVFREYNRGLFKYLGIQI